MWSHIKHAVLCWQDPGQETSFLSGCSSWAAATSLAPGGQHLVVYFVAGLLNYCKGLLQPGIKFSAVHRIGALCDHCYNIRRLALLISGQA